MGWNWKDFLRGSVGRGNVRRQRNRLRGKNFSSSHPLTDKPLTNYEKYGSGHSFKSHIATTQLARTERFECQFQFPPAILGVNSDFPLNCSLMAEEVQVPGMVLTNKEFNLGNWTHYRNNNMQFLGNEINITFYTSADWIHRAKFESWMALCVNPTSKEVTFPEYTWGEIAINVMDIQNNFRSSWVLHEVTPKVLNLIPLSMGAVGVVRTTLIVSATYWESKAIEVKLGQAVGGEYATYEGYNDAIININPDEQFA